MHFLPVQNKNTCKICERQFRDGEWNTHHMCVDCWKQHLTWLRTFTAGYHERLQRCLSDKGIVVFDPSTEGLDERGVPYHQNSYGFTHCMPLISDPTGVRGGDECGIFTVNVRESLLVLPDNGVGLRYISNANQGKYLETAFNMFHDGVLALASDGHDLYGLTNDGMIRSTAEGWEEIRLFDKLEEIRRMADAAFPAGTKEKFINEILNGKRWSYGDGNRESYYYDSKQKALIMEYESGCSHDGIDINYCTCSRKSLLTEMLRFRRLRDIADEIRAGKYPDALIAADLPLDDSGAKIEVPDSYHAY